MCLRNLSVFRCCHGEWRQSAQSSSTASLPPAALTKVAFNRATEVDIAFLINGTWHFVISILLFAVSVCLVHLISMLLLP